MNSLVVLLWILGGTHIGQEAYVGMRDTMPWQWFQGQTRARIVTLSVASGLFWPGVLIFEQLIQIPFFYRWSMAFIKWEWPRDDSRDTP